MTEKDHPNQSILALLRQAVELHCRTHVALGPDDAEEWFRRLSGEVWEQYGLGQWDTYVEEREQRIRAYEERIGKSKAF
jgi:hypothetical protein